MAFTSHTYFVLRGDNPSQLFIPLESFRYVTWPPLAHASSHADLVSTALPKTQSCCRVGLQQITIALFLFNCVAPLGKETTGCFRSLSLRHQVSIYNLQIHSSLKARLRHLGPTWDCYLWHTTWPVWPCCAVSTWWVFSGTGEVGWRWSWSHNIGALTASVGDPWKCRVRDSFPGSICSLSFFREEFIWPLGSCRHWSPGFSYAASLYPVFLLSDLFHLSWFWLVFHVCISVFKSNLFLIPTEISIYLYETVPLKQCIPVSWLQ